jgi:ABC-2 type transport system permease protein
VAIALSQALLFLLLMPLAGFDPRAVDWPLALSLLALASLGLSAAGFAIAWWLDSTQGYHVVMSVLLIPLWILSGAMFPAGGAAPAIAWLMRVNPMAYGVAGIRRALYGAHAAQAGVSGSAALELAVVLAFALIAIAVAVRVSLREKT